MTTQTLESRVTNLETLVSRLNNTNSFGELRYGQPDIRPALNTDLTAEIAARIAGDASSGPLKASPSSLFTKNNDTTLANITGFTINLAASSRYAFMFALHYTSSSVADIKFDFGTPATAVGIFHMDFLSTASVITSSFFAPSSTPLTAGGNGGNPFILTGIGTLTTTSADVIQFRAAQNTGEVSDTTVSTDSYILAWKLP